jgi:hypothetical protein
MISYAMEMVSVSSIGTVLIIYMYLGVDVITYLHQLYLKRVILHRNQIVIYAKYKVPAQNETMRKKLILHPIKGEWRGGGDSRGKSILIQSSLSSIPNYAMGVYLL